MSIRILFFASLADATGLHEVEIAPSAHLDVGSVYDRFASDFPRLEAHRSSVLYAVNKEFAKRDTLVHDGDEIAFFPPVSGG